GPTVSKDFKVLPAWRDELRRRLEGRGVKIDLLQWEAGGHWIDIQLERYVARSAVGDSGSVRRTLPYDAPLRKAIDLMNKGQSQKDLFTLVQSNVKPINTATPPKNQAAARP